MRFKSALAVTVLILAGCSRAATQAPDPGNPFHCGVAFSVYLGIAKATNSQGVAMLERRMQIEAVKAAALPASKRSREEGERLTKRLMENDDEAYRTVVACMKQQDAGNR